MSLTSPRVIVPLAAFSLAALTIASCGQQGTPTAPSSAAATAPQPTVTEYFVTLYDPGPEPARETAVAKAVGDPEPAPPASGSAPVPWPPGPPPLASPGVPMPTPPSLHFRMTPIKVDPEPVAHSGIPVSTSGCHDLKYTWYYDQHLNAETDTPVTLSERENFFDGRFVNKNNEGIRLVVHVPVILHTRWCSAYAKPHYVQTRFKGQDDKGEKVEISGPLVRLLTP